MTLRERVARWIYPELGRAADDVKRLKTVLRKHHEWHQSRGEVSAPDGMGGYVTWDAADAYTDSDLHDETVTALSPSVSAPDNGEPKCNYFASWLGADGKTYSTTDPEVVTKRIALGYGSWVVYPPGRSENDGIDCSTCTDDGIRSCPMGLSDCKWF